MAFHRDSGSGGKRGGQRFGGPKKSFGGKKKFDGRFDDRRPEMHSAICSDCGASCQVPFKPNGSRPVLCRSCFGDNDDRGSGKSFGSKRFEDKPRHGGGGDTNTTDILREINNKLDLIIRSLND